MDRHEAHRVSASRGIDKELGFASHHGASITETAGGVESGATGKPRVDSLAASPFVHLTLKRRLERCPEGDLPVDHGPRNG